MFVKIAPNPKQTPTKQTPMLKETKEFNVLLGSGINAGYRAAADGKVNLADVAVLLDPLLKGEAGVQGIGLVPAELAAASIEDKVGSIGAFEVELSSAVPDDDQYDISAFVGGIQSIVSMVGRKTKTDTLTKVVEVLNGPHVANGDWTVKELSALID